MVQLNNGSELNWHIKVNKGEIYEYLAMKLDDDSPGKALMDMTKYVKNRDFLNNLQIIVTHPWPGRFFNVSGVQARFHKVKLENFHI